MLVQNLNLFFRIMMCVVNKKSLKVEFLNNFMDKAALTDGISIIKFMKPSHVAFSSSVGGLPSQ